MKPDAREAAGFVLLRRANGGAGPGLEVLLLRNVRWGEWGFPKGHRDGSDASLAAAALRELEEETGLSAGDIEPVNGFEHVLRYEARRTADGPSYEKTVCYFAALVALDATIRLSGEHDAAEWLALGTAEERLPHGALVEVLGRAASAASTR